MLLTNDTLYVGPVVPAYTLALSDHHIHVAQTEQRGLPSVYRVLFSFGADNCGLHMNECPTGTDWGAGPSHDIALRFALGAMFGPMDDQYDEAELRAKLRQA